MWGSSSKGADDERRSRHGSESIVSSSSRRHPSRTTSNPTSASYAQQSQGAYPELTESMQGRRESRDTRESRRERSRSGETERSSHGHRRKRRSRSRESERSHRRHRSRSRDKDDRKKEKHRRHGDEDKDRGTSRAGPDVIEVGASGTYDDRVGGNDQSFTQFPGQAIISTASIPGGFPSESPTHHTRPEDFSSHIPDQFPGQFPAHAAQPYVPPESNENGGAGLAADYYGDQGESVAHQPGVRPHKPTLIVGAEPHLMAASAVSAPPVEPSAVGGVGAAASFFTGAGSEANLGGSSSSRPSKPGSKPGRTSSLPGVGAAVGGAALGYAASQFYDGSDSKPPKHSKPSKHGKPGKHSSISVAGSSYGAGGSSGSTVYYDAGSTNGRPSGQHSSSLLPALGIGAAGAAAGYFAGQDGHHNADGDASPGYISASHERPDRPGKQHHHSSSNAGLYAGAALGAAGLAAAAGHHNHHSNHSHHNSHGHQSGYSSSSTTGLAVRRKRRGPGTRFADFFRDPDGVGQYEEYTRIIGVCRDCFEPNSSPADAPRKHHYHKRGKRSTERLGTYGRIGKDSRYYSSDGGSRKHHGNKSSWLATGLAGYGLAKVGKTLFNTNRDFDDTYSVRTGRRDERPGGSVYVKDSHHSKHRSRSRSRSKHRAESVMLGAGLAPGLAGRGRSRSRDRVERGITADGKLYKKDPHGSLFGNSKTTYYEDVGGRRHTRRSGSSSSSNSSNRSRSKRKRKVEKGITADGKLYKKDSQGGFFGGNKTTIYEDVGERRRRHSRSRSRSRDRHNGLLGATVGAGLAASALRSHSRSRNRSRSRSSSRRRHKGSRHSPTGSITSRGHRSRGQDAGFFGGFFSTPSANKHRKTHSKSKKRKGFFSFSNGSSSSSSTDFDLAFGGNVSGSRQDVNRTNRKEKDSKSTDAALMGIAAGLGAFAANDVRKGSRLGKDRRAEVIAVKEASDPYGSSRRHSRKSHRSRRGSGSSIGDDGWESASDDDDSSVDSALAFGSSLTRKSSKGRSTESLVSNGSGTGKWWWRWGGSKEKKSRDSTSNYAGTAVAGLTGATAGAAFAGSGSRQHYDSRFDTGMSSTSSLPSMHSVQPIPTMDPNNFDASRNQPTYSGRPAPVPIQQPQPLPAIGPAVYEPQQYSYTAPTGPPVFAGPVQQQTPYPAKPFDSRQYAVEGNFKDDSSIQREVYRDKPKRRMSSPTFMAADPELETAVSAKIHHKFSRDKESAIVDFKRRDDSPSRESKKESSRRRKDEEKAALEAARDKSRPDRKKSKSGSFDLDEKRSSKRDSKTVVVEQPLTESSWVVPVAVGAFGAAVGAAITSEKKSKKDDDSKESRRKDKEYDKKSRKKSYRPDDTVEIKTELDRRADLAKKAASKVIADHPYFSDDDEPTTSVLDKYNDKSPDMASYWVPPELRYDHEANDQAKKDHRRMDTDVQVYNVPEIITVGPQSGNTSSIPYGVPRDQMDPSRITINNAPFLQLIPPTPPGSTTGSVRGDVSIPSSPDVRPAEPKKAPKDRSVDSPKGKKSKRDDKKTYESTARDAPKYETQPDRSKQVIVESQPEEDFRKPSVGSRVSWGPDETRIFHVETPSDVRDEFIAGSPPQVRKSREGHEQDRNESPPRKRESKDFSSDGKQQYAYRSAEPPAVPTTQSVQMPGSFGQDIDLAATMAAGLEASGFDPSLVTNDPKYHRRESPPGSDEEMDKYRRHTSDRSVESPRYEIKRTENHGAPTSGEYYVPPTQPSLESQIRNDLDHTIEDQSRSSTRDRKLDHSLDSAIREDMEDVIDEKRMSKKDRKAAKKKAKKSRENSVVESPVSPVDIGSSSVASSKYEPTYTEEPKSYDHEESRDKRDRRDKEEPKSEYFVSAAAGAVAAATIAAANHGRKSQDPKHRQDSDDMFEDAQEYDDRRQAARDVAVEEYPEPSLNGSRRHHHHDKPVEADFAPEQAVYDPRESHREYEDTAKDRHAKDSRSKKDRTDSDRYESPELDSASLVSASVEDENDDSKRSRRKSSKSNKERDDSDFDMRSVADSEIGREGDEERRKHRKKHRHSTTDRDEVASSVGDDDDSRKSRKSKDKDKDRDKDKEKKSGIFGGLFGKTTEVLLDPGKSKDKERSRSRDRRGTDSLLDPGKSKDRDRSRSRDRRSTTDSLLDPGKSKDRERSRSRDRRGDEEDGERKKKHRHKDRESSNSVYGAPSEASQTMESLASLSRTDSRRSRDGEDDGERKHRHHSKRSEDGERKHKHHHRRSSARSDDDHSPGASPTGPQSMSGSSEKTLLQESSRQISVFDFQDEQVDASPNTDRRLSSIQTSEPSQSSGSARIASPTAVPILFKRPPSSPGYARSVSHGSVGQMTPGSGQSRQKSRPSSTEFRPLFLVEQHSARKEPAPEESYPSLPSSRTTSRSPSEKDPEDVDSDDERARTLASLENRRAPEPLNLDSHRAELGRQVVEPYGSSDSTPKASTFTHDQSVPFTMRLDRDAKPYQLTDTTPEPAQQIPFKYKYNVTPPHSPSRLTHSIGDLFPPGAETSATRRGNDFDDLPPLPVSRAVSPTEHSESSAGKVDPFDFLDSEQQDLSAGIADLHKQLTRKPSRDHSIVDARETSEISPEVSLRESNKSLEPSSIPSPPEIVMHDAYAEEADDVKELEQPELSRKKHTQIQSSSSKSLGLYQASVESVSDLSLPYKDSSSTTKDMLEDDNATLVDSSSVIDPVEPTPGQKEYHAAMFANAVDKLAQHMPSGTQVSSNNVFYSGPSEPNIRGFDKGRDNSDDKLADLPPVPPSRKALREEELLGEAHKASDAPPDIWSYQTQSPDPERAFPPPGVTYQQAAQETYATEVAVKRQVESTPAERSEPSPLLSRKSSKKDKKSKKKDKRSKSGKKTDDEDLEIESTPTSSKVDHTGDDRAFEPESLDRNIIPGGFPESPQDESFLERAAAPALIGAAAAGIAVAAASRDEPVEIAEDEQPALSRKASKKDKKDKKNKKKSRSSTAQEDDEMEIDEKDLADSQEPQSYFVEPQQEEERTITTEPEPMELDKVIVDDEPLQHDDAKSPAFPLLTRKPSKKDKKKAKKEKKKSVSGPNEEEDDMTQPSAPVSMDIGDDEEVVVVDRSQDNFKAIVPEDRVIAPFVSVPIHPQFNSDGLPWATGTLMAYADEFIPMAEPAEAERSLYSHLADDIPGLEEKSTREFEPKPSVIPILSTQDEESSKPEFTEGPIDVAEGEYSQPVLSRTLSKKEKKKDKKAQKKGKGAISLQESATEADSEPATTIGDASTFPTDLIDDEVDALSTLLDPAQQSEDPGPSQSRELSTGLTDQPLEEAEDFVSLSRKQSKKDKKNAKKVKKALDEDFESPPLQNEPTDLGSDSKTASKRLDPDDTPQDGPRTDSTDVLSRSIRPIGIAQSTDYFEPAPPAADTEECEIPQLDEEQDETFFALTKKQKKADKKKKRASAAATPLVKSDDEASKSLESQVEETVLSSETLQKPESNIPISEPVSEVEEFSTAKSRKKDKKKKKKDRSSTADSSHDFDFATEPSTQAATPRNDVDNDPTAPSDLIKQSAIFAAAGAAIGLGVGALSRSRSQSRTRQPSAPQMSPELIPLPDEEDKDLILEDAPIITRSQSLPPRSQSLHVEETDYHITDTPERIQLDAPEFEPYPPRSPTRYLDNETGVAHETVEDPALQDAVPSVDSPKSQSRTLDDSVDETPSFRPLSHEQALPDEADEAQPEFTMKSSKKDRKRKGKESRQASEDPTSNIQGVSDTSFIVDQVPHIAPKDKLDPEVELALSEAARGTPEAQALQPPQHVDLVESISKALEAQFATSKDPVKSAEYNLAIQAAEARFTPATGFEVPRGLSLPEPEEAPKSKPSPSLKEISEGSWSFGALKEPEVDPTVDIIRDSAEDTKSVGQIETIETTKDAPEDSAGDSTLKRKLSKKEKKKAKKQKGRAGDALSDDDTLREADIMDLDTARERTSSRAPSVHEDIVMEDAGPIKRTASPEPDEWELPLKKGKDKKSKKSRSGQQTPQEGSSATRNLGIAGTAALAAGVAASTYNKHSDEEDKQAKEVADTEEFESVIPKGKKSKKDKKKRKEKNKEPDTSAPESRNLSVAASPVLAPRSSINDLSFGKEAEMGLSTHQLGDESMRPVTSEREGDIEGRKRRSPGEEYFDHRIDETSKRITTDKTLASIDKIKSVVRPLESGPKDDVVTAGEYTACAPQTPRSPLHFDVTAPALKTRELEPFASSGITDRDSGMHLDSPHIPRDISPKPIERDSGIHDTDALAVDRSIGASTIAEERSIDIPTPVSMDEQDVLTPRPGGSPVAMEVQGLTRNSSSSVDPLNISVEMDPMYDVSVSRPDDTDNESVEIKWKADAEDTDMEGGEGIAGVFHRGLTPSQSTENLPPPSPVDSTTKERSSILFKSSPANKSPGGQEARDTLTDFGPPREAKQHSRSTSEPPLTPNPEISQSSDLSKGKERDGRNMFKPSPQDAEIAENRDRSLAALTGATILGVAAAEVAHYDQDSKTYQSVFGSSSKDVDPPRNPLDTAHSERRQLDPITEDSPIDDSPLGRKGRRAQQDTSPQPKKSLRHAGAPLDSSNKKSQSLGLLQDELPVPKKRSRSRSNGDNESVLSTEDLMSRLSWPIVDENEHTVDLDRAKSRERRDLSPNAMLDPSSGEKRDISGGSDRSAGRSTKRFITPDRDLFRPGSTVSNRSASTGTPPLRRVDRSLSGDLRAASRLSEPRAKGKRRPDPPPAELPNILTPSTNVPDLDKGKSRAGPDMADVYVSNSDNMTDDCQYPRHLLIHTMQEAWGEHHGSPMSPTRPHSVVRKQSIQLLDMENRLSSLISENQILLEGKTRAEQELQRTRGASDSLTARDVQLRDRDDELDRLKSTLEWLQNEVTRLNDANETLAATNTALAATHNERYDALQTSHDEKHEQLVVTSRELGQVATGRESIEAAMEQKDQELERLREELDNAQAQIRELQRQILASQPSDDLLVVRDEDYFDHSFQTLCTNVQQWVMRFSKFSDMERARLLNEIKEDWIAELFDNAVIDGSEVDDYLDDRKKRRDVFMSVVMSMIAEHVFTRYLFGMDREQRHKLKSLQTILSEVGPQSAVNKWRATTLTLLTRRPNFASQRDKDIEDVANAIFSVLSTVLPPPKELEEQSRDSLRKVLRSAVDLSIEMRTQRSSFLMLPPLQPGYDVNGDVSQTITFNASMMNNRSGDGVSNEDLENQGATVQMVLFPPVIKEGDDDAGDDRIVVCPAQVLVAPMAKDKKVVRIASGSAMDIDQGPRASSQGLEGGMI
ncbi:MAG: hypothetical protein M1814_000854 [Vezdaea aestivalis]|nr:MAG: hypothetical protein M1814_000854 [Vezdaea aestivalis]